MRIFFVGVIARTENVLARFLFLQKKVHPTAWLSSGIEQNEKNHRVVRNIRRWTIFHGCSGSQNWFRERGSGEPSSAREQI